MPYNGITISVTAETNAGGRKHMEDYIAVNLSPDDELLANPELREQAFVGVFDGHGGKEAAKYAREKMWQMIQQQPKFQTHDRLSVREAINDAYLQLHEAMLSSRDSWVPNKTGDLSTAGTTASTVIIRKNHIYVANVGDSTGIMGVRNPDYGQPGEPPVIAKLLTKDHKPEDPEEQENIKKLGGQVALSMKGVMRVVWERERTKSNGKKEIDFIPFLSVARSLGDFWSYNSRSGQYTVSPVPYITDFPLNLHEQKFIVLASDGLWNVMTPSDVVDFINEYDSRREMDGRKKDVVNALIKEALSRWERRKLQADNIAVLIAYLNEEEVQDGSNEIMGSQNGSQEITNSNNNMLNNAANSEAAGPSRELSPPLSSLSSSSSSLTSNSSQNKEFMTKISNGTMEYIKKVFPNGSTIEYENFLKYRHKRKHKKHKKHSSSKHKHSSKSTVITLSDTSNSTSNSSSINDTSSSSSSLPPPSLFPPLPLPPSETDTVVETTMPCLDDSLKRRHTPLLEDIDDEGIFLLPSDAKRQKLNPSATVTTVEDTSPCDDLLLMTDDPLTGDHLSVPLVFSEGVICRSQRISTDNRSDSGSSGIVSDIDTNSTSPPVSSTGNTITNSITLEEDSEEFSPSIESEELMESSSLDQGMPQQPVKCSSIPVIIPIIEEDTMDYTSSSCDTTSITVNNSPATTTCTIATPSVIIEAPYNI